MTSKSVQIPGAVWVILLAVVNAVAFALKDAYPGAEWVPPVVTALLLVAKAIQVYVPKPGVEAVYPEPFVIPAEDIKPGRVVTVKWAPKYADAYPAYLPGSEMLDNPYQQPGNVVVAEAPVVTEQRKSIRFLLG